MEEAVMFSFCQFKGKPAYVLWLTFLKGAFHARFRGARLCFHCMKTPSLCFRKGKNRSRWSQFWVTDPFIIAFVLGKQK
jgi:hypothetical protein